MSQYLRAILAQRFRFGHGRDGKARSGGGSDDNTPHIQELVKKGDVMGSRRRSFERERASNFDVSLRDLFKSGRHRARKALSNADRGPTSRQDQLR